MAVTLVNDSNFQDSLKQHRLAVVKFYADWCGSCRLFKPKYKRISEEEGYTHIAFLDVNAQESPETKKMAGVTNLPYFAIFKDGQLLEGVATSKEESVKELLDKLKN